MNAELRVSWEVPGDPGFQSRFRRNRFIAKAVDTLVTAGCLAGMLFSYRGTWADKCDYSLKEWSTVGLGAALLRSVASLTSSGLLLFYPDNPRATAWANHIKLTILDLFRFAWFLYGSVVVFVNQSCDDVYSKPAWIWSCVLWSLQACTYFLPCILIILLVPCFMCGLCIWGSVNDTGGGVPDDIMSKLRPRRYADLLNEGALDITPGGAPAAVSGGNNLLANALPDVMGGAMTHLLNRLNSSASTTQQNGSCAICVCDFEADDQVLQLPCDPRKHVFHATCVQEWLQRSQQCPMCRVNIVQVIDQHNQQV